MSRGPSLEIFSQGRYTNGQQTHEKRLNVISLQRNRITVRYTFHSKNGYYQREKNQQVDEGHMRPGNDTRISNFLLLQLLLRTAAPYISTFSLHVPDHCA